MQEKISVIITFYNEEKYLARCITSVINQSYKNLDILLVDDGSTDTSKQIAEAYMQKDTRIQYIYEANQGLSVARNTGIENSKTEYLMFVDGDDELVDTMIEELYNLLKNNNSDIAVCSFIRLKENDTFKQVDNEVVWSVDDHNKYDQIWDDYVRTVVQWNKLYKKEIFNDLRYPVGKYHEDEYVIHHELERAHKITYTNRILYKYHIHEGTITYQSSMQKRLHAAQGFYDRILFFKDRGMKDYLSRSFYQFRWYVRHSLKHKKEFEDTNLYVGDLVELKNKVFKEFSYYNNPLYILKGKLKNALFLLKTKMKEMLKK